MITLADLPDEIEFRTSDDSDLWLPFYPGATIRSPLEWVADRNQHYGWTKYRFLGASAGRPQ